TEPDVLWRGVTVPPPRHPTGLPAGAADARGPDSATVSSGETTARIGAAARTRGTCAWRFGQRGVARCRHPKARPDDAWRACERYEAALDCQTCGACCRAAYHSVEVQKRDPVIKKQPSYIVDRGTYLEIRRSGDRCAALAGGEIVEGK